MESSKEFIEVSKYSAPLESQKLRDSLTMKSPRFASRKLLVIAVILMLASATFDTTATKYMNRQEAPRCKTCAPTFFEAPFFQTWIGYVGQLVFLPIFLVDKYHAKKHDQNRRFDFVTTAAELQKPQCPIWLWIFPLLFDFVSTACLNYATLLTQASTVQMLRSFNIILTFVLSAFTLKNRIYVHQILGVALVLIGILLVGFYAMLNPENATNHSNLQWVGILTALLGTGLSALQWVLEETLFRRYFCSPFEGVGYMGLYGTLLGAIALLLGEWLGFESVSGAFYQMSLGQKESIILIVFSILYIISLAVNTAAGITVTKLASSLMRTVVNAGRTISIWTIEMILQWASFNLLNFSGLLVILAAMIIYNYNYITDKESHWFGDKSLRKPAACLPNKVEVTHRLQRPLTPATDHTSSLEDAASLTPKPRRRKPTLMPENTSQNNNDNNNKEENNVKRHAVGVELSEQETHVIDIEEVPVVNQ